MAFEKRYAAIAARLFVSNGKANGEIELADTTSFKVKQKVVVIASGEMNLELEVKAVLSDTILKVGPQNSNIRQITDVSAYTVSKNAAVLADEQPRPAITEVEIHRAVYDEEPTVAYRNVLVDKYGRYWDDQNKLPVEAIVNLDQIDVDVNSISSPFTLNPVLALANTEYMVTIPQTARFLMIKIRGNALSRVSFVAGGTSSNYFTIEYGCFYSWQNIKLNNNLNIYIQTNKPNQIAEILYWT